MMKEDSAPRSGVNASPAPQNGKFSLSLGSKKPATASTTTFKQPVKRPRALLEEEEHDDLTNGPNRTESILSFGQPAVGAVEAAEAPRVIQSLPNRDWREESKKKRQKSGLPGDARNGTNNTNVPDVDIVNATTPAFGLTVVQSPSLDEATSSSIANPTPLPLISAPPPQLTADEAALLALTAGPTTSTHTIRPSTPPAGPQSEDSAFRTAYTSAPRMASLDEYTATPVEGFGAAILRGYLAPGETLEKRAERATALKERVRRPGLLGIGAKETAQGLEGVELGAWGRGVKKGKGGGRKEEVGYLPLQVRSKVTGEVMGEEEMKRRVEAGKMLVEEKAKVGSRQDEDGGGRRKMIEDGGRSEGRRDDERYDRRRRRDDDDRRSRDDGSSRREIDGSYQSRRDDGNSEARRGRRDDEEDKDRYSSRDKDQGSRRGYRDANGDRDRYRDRDRERERERRPARDDDDSRRRDRNRDGRNGDRRDDDRRRR